MVQVVTSRSGEGFAYTVLAICAEEVARAVALIGSVCVVVPDRNAFSAVSTHVSVTRSGRNCTRHTRHNVALKQQNA